MIGDITKRQRMAERDVVDIVFDRWAEKVKAQAARPEGAATIQGESVIYLANGSVITFIDDESTDIFIGINDG